MLLSYWKQPWRETKKWVRKRRAKEWVGAKKTKKGLATPLTGTTVFLRNSFKKMRGWIARRYFTCQKRQPGMTAGRGREKEEVSRFVSQSFSRHCSSLFPSHSPSPPAFNILCSKEVCPFNSCLSQLALFYILERKSYTFNRTLPSWAARLAQSWTTRGMLVHKLPLFISVSESLSCSQSLWD